ncbi:MAG: hypothetical protein GY801_26465 [bacterium]|nr:hypothetical protein [bacterium]
MTLKPLELSEHEFLILDYSSMDFIVNREQLFASIILEDAVEFESEFNYLSSLMAYREQTLPVFDFDAFLLETFSGEFEQSLKVALIIDLASFSEGNRSLYQERILREHTEFSSEYLALKVHSHAGIKRVALSEVCLIPAGLRERQSQEGILGCRFLAGGKIQYFVDIETLVFNWIARSETDTSNYKDFS